MDIKGKENYVDMEIANELEERFHNPYVKKIIIKDMDQYEWKSNREGYGLMIVLLSIFALAYIILNLTNSMDNDGLNNFIVNSLFAVIMGTAILWGVHNLNYYIIIKPNKVIYKRGTFSKKIEYAYLDIQYARITKKNKIEILLNSGKSIVVPVNDPIRASIFLNKCGNKVENAKVQEKDNYTVCAPRGIKISGFVFAVFFTEVLYTAITVFITLYENKEVNVVGTIFVLIIGIVYMLYMRILFKILFNYVRIEGNNAKFFRVFHKTLELKKSDIQKIELIYTIGTKETDVKLFYNDKEIFRYSNTFNNSEKMKIFLKEIPVTKEKYVHEENDNMNFGS